MKRKKGFTLIELLVVISIIALLLSILMPSLQRVRRQGQAVVCMSNFRQWGTIFEMYLMDNNRKFVATVDGSSYGWTPPGSDRPRELNNWVHLLLPYYTDFSILECPSTRPHPFDTGTQYATTIDVDKTHMSTVENIYGQDGVVYDQANVSFGINNHTLMRIRADGSPNYSITTSWARIDEIRGSKRNNVPVLLDSTVRAGAPYWGDRPPEFRGHDDSNIPPARNMIRRFALDRHSGGVNVVFSDWSVRHVSIKNMWELDWHNNYTLWRDPEWPDWMKRFSKD